MHRNLFQVRKARSLRKEHQMERDPVCGMQVDPRNAAAQMEYQGRTHHFCSEDCHQKFMQNPAQYVGHQTRT